MNEIQSTTQPTPVRRDRGFTLVELLIVIVVLGILATVTVFAVNGITDSAEETSCDTRLAQIDTAATAYLALEGGSAIAGADSDARFATLVAADFLETDAAMLTDFDLAADGTVTAAAGGSCV